MARVAVLSVFLACLATHAVAADEAPAKAKQLVLDDKTLSQAEVNRLLSQGYKPQKGRGDAVLYCRSEAQVGTRFDKKVCLSAEQIKARTQDSQDAANKFQKDNGNPTVH
jgi:hypothetical protein